MASRFALARTPMYDKAGNLNRAWLLYFDGLSAGSSSSAGGYESLNPVGVDVNIGLTNGNNPSLELLLDGTAYAIHTPTVNAGTPTAGDKFTLYIDQDATGNRPFPTFDTGAGNFAADVNNQQPMLTASTRTTMIFTFHGDVWGLDSFRTNGSTT